MLVGFKGITFSTMVEDEDEARWRIKSRSDQDI